MIINQTTGQAAIMGSDRKFTYDHGSTALTILDLTFAEASELVAKLEGKTVLVERAASAQTSLPLGDDPTPNHAHGSNGKAKVSVDPEKMAALAASNPAKPPKETKAAKAGKAAPPPEPEAADEDDDIPFPEPTKAAPAKTSAKAAPAEDQGDAAVRGGDCEDQSALREAQGRRAVPRAHHRPRSAH